MKAYTTALAAALALGGLATQAHATVSTITTPSTTTSANGLMSTFGGVNTINFNSSTTLPTGFVGGQVVQGNSGGQYASPNGDTSNFYAVGGAPSYTGTSTFTPGGSYNYFGLYWGSIDAYNTITFSLAGAVVASYTGSAFPPANGSTSAANTNEFVDFLFTGGSTYDTARPAGLPRPSCHAIRVPPCAGVPNLSSFGYMRLPAIAALGLLSVAACAYDPPVQGDRSSASFQRNLKACRTTAERNQGRREGTPGAAIGAIFDFHDTEHQEVQSCMQSRGYALR